MLRSMCLCTPCHIFAQIYIFVCSLPCSCVQIYMLVAMPCASKTFLSPVISFFLCFGPFGRVQIYILLSWPTSIHLGLYQRVWIFSFMHVNVCLLASIINLHVCLSRSRLCHALCPLQACACQSLRPLACVVTSVPPKACLDVTTCKIHLHGAGMLDTPLSPLRVMLICLPCSLCATRLAYFAFLHLCTLAYMFMHESVCRPYSNLMELQTPDPNLHFCLITCLFSLSCT